MLEKKTIKIKATKNDTGDILISKMKRTMQHIIKKRAEGKIPARVEIELHSQKDDKVTIDLGLKAVMASDNLLTALRSEWQAVELY